MLRLFFALAHVALISASVMTIRDMPPRAETLNGGVGLVLINALQR
ncbi:hypothetical protein [Afifella sp. IM 167]|nr:hypothetical protein [Afifella sp. IM 167]